MDFLLNRQADMVERGVVIAAIVAAAITFWFGIGQRIAARLASVQGML